MATEIEVVTDARADTTIAREIARAGSDTRRALSGWALTSGLPSGGGAGGGGVLVVDNFDGTASITVTDPAAASIIDHGDGTITLTLGGTTP